MLGGTVTYLLLAIVVVVGIYYIVNRIIKKKKQKDNFNAFIKPSVKEQLKKDGLANHSYVIDQRFHHALTAQNKEGRVDLILNITNPKIGKKSMVRKGYTLMMREVPVGKKEFVWEVDSIEEIKISDIEKLIKDKDDRKRKPIKYLKQDIVKYKDKTISKLKHSKGKKSLSKSKILKKNNKQQEEISELDVNEINIKDPFDLL